VRAGVPAPVSEEQIADVSAWFQARRPVGSPVGARRVLAEESVELKVMRQRMGRLSFLRLSSYCWRG
jgi:hypothetical protein